MSNEKLIELAAVKLLEDLKPRVDFYTVDNAKSAIAYCLDSNTYKAISHAQEQLEASQLVQVHAFLDKQMEAGFDYDTHETYKHVKRFVLSLSDEEVTG